MRGSLLIVCAVTLGLAGGVLAEQERQSGSGYGTSGGQTGSEQPGTSGQQGMSGRTEHMGMSGQFRLDKASDIINKEVRNPQDEKLGKIHDLAIDVERDRVAYAVLDFGGFLGIGDKYFAVPFTAFTFRADQKQLVLNVDKARLKNAPGFEKNNWPDMANQEWGRTVYSYYNQQPYWERDRGLRGEPISPEQGMQEKERSETTGGRTDMGTGMAGDRFTSGGHKHIVRADGQLMNTGLLNKNDEKIGTIHDLFVDQRSGDVAFAIVKLDADKVGLDNKDQNFAAIPFEVLNFSKPGSLKDRPNITLNNPEKLKGHTFSRDKWPDMNNRQQVETLYRDWGQTPYWQRTGGGTMRHGGESGMHSGTEMRGGTTGGETSGTEQGGSNR